MGNSGPGGWASNNGSFDPPGPGGPVAPISGNFDAESFQPGPAGTYQLYQTVTLPTDDITAATLSWSDRIRNFGGFAPNQEWRVTLRDSSGNLLTTVYHTSPSDNPMQPPTNRSFDLTSFVNAHNGEQIRVSFEEQDSNGFLNVNVDNVSFQVTSSASASAVPEPHSVLLAMVGSVALLGYTRRRRQAA